MPRPRTLGRTRTHRTGNSDGCPARCGRPGRIRGECALAICHRVQAAARVCDRPGQPMEAAFGCEARFSEKAWASRKSVDHIMTYIIAEPCVDLKDMARVEECPVDCIYEGQRSLYIHPDEGVDCGACEAVRPVEAIYYEDDTPRRMGRILQRQRRILRRTGLTKWCSQTRQHRQGPSLERGLATTKSSCRFAAAAPCNSMVWAA